MSEEFLLETKGHCVLCLKLPRSNPEGSTQVFSFNKWTNYLQLDMKKVFSVMKKTTPEWLEAMENADLKGTLCSDCSNLSNEFYQLSLELETIQLKIQSCLESIHGKIEATDRNPEVMDDFKRKMTMTISPSSLFHSHIIEGLRKETLERCASQIGRSGSQLIECDGQLPCVVNLKEEDFADSSAAIFNHAQQWFPVPVISEAQGNFIPGDQQPSTSRSAFASEVQQEQSASFNPTNGLMNEINFPSVSVLHQPTVNVTAQKKRYECEICLESFSRASDLRNHQIQVHGGKGFRCRYCPSTFTGKQGRDKHERKTCVAAQQAFGSLLNRSNPNPPELPQAPPISPGGNGATSLVVVKQEFLGNVDIIPMKRLKRFKCAICSIRFQTASEFNQHLKSNHLGKRYKCSGCSATFKSKTGRYLHKRKYKCGQVAESSNADSTILNGNGANPDQGQGEPENGPAI